MLINSLRDYIDMLSTDYIRYSRRRNVDVDKFLIVYLRDYINFPRQWNVVHIAGG